MDQIGDFFLSVGSAFGTGGVMVLAGVVLLIASRRAKPENQPVMKWIGIPLIGCGGCLVLIPLIIILAALGLGVMMFSGGSSH